MPVASSLFLDFLDTLDFSMYRIYILLAYLNRISNIDTWFTLPEDTYCYIIWEY